MSLSDLLLRMSTQPARIFNLPGGSLGVGAPADVRGVRSQGPLDGGPFAIPLQEPQHSLRREVPDRPGRSDDRPGQGGLPGLGGLNPPPDGFPQTREAYRFAEGFSLRTG